MTRDIEYITGERLPKPRGHYSTAVRALGFVFVSGQLPVTAEGETLSEAPFEDQARQTLQNLAASLEAAGSSIADLVQVRVYITDVEQWSAFNVVYAEWAGETKPARCVVPVAALSRGAAIEIEATALASHG